MIYQQAQQPCSVVLDMTSLKQNTTTTTTTTTTSSNKQVYCGMNEDDEHPPLDSITVTTCSISNHPEEDNTDDDDDDNDNDNDSCCSSLTNEPSSAEPQSTATKQQCRSIFPNYWSAQGYQQAPFYRSSVSTDMHFIAPRTTVAQVQASVAVGSSCPNNNNNNNNTRRSIFGTVQQPQDDEDQALLRLLAVQQQPRLLSPFRKTRSAPAIEHRSALKPSRYAGGTNAKGVVPPSRCTSSRTVQRSVSFSDQVCVAIVPPRSVLVEHYAMQGWSNWFA